MKSSLHTAPTHTDCVNSGQVQSQPFSISFAARLALRTGAAALNPRWLLTAARDLLETKMKITNINGNPGNTCTCGNWLAHYERFCGKRAHIYCAARWCWHPAEIGVHAQKDHSADKNWYIVPLCSKHGAGTVASLDIGIFSNFVPASVSLTCARQSFPSSVRST
jgi:hypothetical protein